jgi:hypothetical protein
MPDNKIRVKQLNKAEVSGYIGAVYAETLSGKNTDLSPAVTSGFNLKF